jgi:beta-galactosidase/beta-glucuronidase
LEEGMRQNLDLTGSWDLLFDPHSSGIQAGWPRGDWPAAEAQTVQVPALWNLTHPDAEGVGFYRKTFTVPAGWAGQALLLHVGGASYRLDAWLNGVHVGSHEGAYTPFSLDITTAARLGRDNELILRIAGLSRSRAVDGMVLQQCPASKQSWFYTEAGLWGAVSLEALPLLSCRAVAIDPDLHGERVEVNVEAHNASAECSQAELRILITSPRGDIVAETVSAVAAPPGVAHYLFRIPIPRPVPWSCENPALYRLRATLTPTVGAPDSLASTFGMRDFTVQDGQFFLNGAPIFLKGILLQPNYAGDGAARDEPG